MTSLEQIKVDLLKKEIKKWSGLHAVMLDRLIVEDDQNLDPNVSDLLDQMSQRYSDLSKSVKSTLKQAN